MSFGAPGFLLLLIAVPVVVAAAAAWLAWRRAARRRFGALAPARAELPVAIAAILLIVAGIAFTAFAAARPQFGHEETEVAERGIDLAIVLDVSQSMLAGDVEPSRLARAQEEIDALLGRMDGDRVGLVMFAGRPLVRSTLTSDLRALRIIVAGVEREATLIPPGSDLGAAIREALRLVVLGEAETRAILIVSDGEDHGATVSAAANDARARGVLVYAAGVGTRDGAPVRRYDADTRELVVRRDAAGEPIITRLNDEALRDLAGGSYIELSGDGRPLAGLAAELESLAATTFATEEQREPLERFQIFVAIALGLVLAEAALMFVLRRPAPLPRGARLWPLAAGGLFVAALCTGGAAELNREGNRRYLAGEYESALGRYQQAQASARDAAGEDDALRHNASNALNRLGEYGAAADEASRALPGDDAVMEALLQYALGNHRAGAGLLEDAIEAYRRALLADPGDADAKHNLELLHARLENTIPTPTPPPEEPPPSPTGEGQGTPNASEGDGTPEATPGISGQQGEPAPSDAEMSPEELRRSLEEALRGIDQDFTLEEALRVLDLLEEQNRRSTEEIPRRTGPGPDY